MEKRSYYNIVLRFRRYFVIEDRPVGPGLAQSNLKNVSLKCFVWFEYDLPRCTVSRRLSRAGRH